VLLLPELLLLGVLLLLLARSPDRWLLRPAAAAARCLAVGVGCLLRQALLVLEVGQAHLPAKSRGRLQATS
jgi:hypothetical protein